MEDKTEPAVCSHHQKRLEDLKTKKKGCIISNAFCSPDNQSINDYSKVVLFELGFAQNVEDTIVPLSKVINDVSVNSKVMSITAVVFLSK